MTDSNIINLIESVDSILVSKALACDVDSCHLNIPPSSDYLSIIAQNIRSINANFSGFEVLLSRLKINCDILVLTECWLSKAPIVPTLPGYTSFTTQQNHLQNDGVVVYTKDTLSVSAYEPVFHDGNCLVINLPNNDTSIVCIYRSPSYKNTDRFYESLDNILHKLSSVKNVMVTGDINVAINADKLDTSSEKYLNLTAYHGFLPAHTFITRDLSGTCLDHVLLKTKKPSITLVPQSTLTDHKCVIVYWSLKMENNSKTFMQTKINYEGIRKEICNIDTNIIYKQKDPNISLTFLINTISTAIKNNSETKMLPRRQRIIKPWITPGLLRCIRHRDNLHKKSNRFPNNEILKITYKRYRNFCNGLIKRLKRKFDKEQISNAGNDSKKLWHAIKSITSTSKIYKHSNELLSSDSSPQTEVNKVNEYFVNVGKSLAQSIPQNNKSDPCNHIPLNSKSFFMAETDELEVDHIIRDLKSVCATGIDKISNKILKDHKDYLVPLLTFIFNQCLQMGTFPTALKISNVHPIHKSGDRNRVSNYRPISILPSLSKILEKIINNRLVLFLENNNLLSPNQFGFRRNKSTEDAVMNLTNSIATNLDKSKKCVSIFLDLAKAFDTVSVPLLLRKLERLGVRGVQLDLFRDYLSNRFQCVSIGEHTSSTLPVHYGVPQGSILGPTLFLVYINDLLQLNIPQGKAISYADDTALVFAADSWELTFEAAQHGCNIVRDWLSQNLLSLNVDKTKYVTFSIRSSGQPKEDLSLHFHHCATPNLRNCMCLPLQRVPTIKYLGVLIDSNLSFKPHIDLLSGRIRKLIYVFKTLRHILEPITLKQVYLALCQSIISYCISAWGGAPKSYLKTAEVAQRAILKVCTFRPFLYPTTLLYNFCEVLTVRQLFLLSILRKQHNAVIFNPTIKNRRRKHNICKTERFRTTYIRRFFSFLGPFMYNKVNKIKFIHHLNYCSFKKEVTKLLLSLTYNDTEDLLVVLQ